jgi:aspartate aminotransferase-like enzyme
MWEVNDLDYPKRKLIMLPGPTNVPDRVMNAMLKPVINHRGETFIKLLKDVTEKTKSLFQTEQNTIVLSASGTGGVEASVWNVIRLGDKAIVPVFGEFSERLAEMIEIAGGTAIRVKSEFGSTPSLESVKQEIEGCQDLKAIYLVHNETSTGCTLQYLEEASRIAKERGAFVIIDAISSLGGYAIPTDKWSIDMCVTGSQKCLAAPPGLALLSVSNDLVEYMKKVPPRTRYFDLVRQLEYLSRGETPFTPALPLYYALDEALTLLIEEGLEKRVQRHSKFASAFYHLISAMGLKLFAHESVRSNTVIAAIYPNGIDDKQFRKRMNEEHDVVIAGGFGNLKGKLFRIGCMGDISESHASRTVTALAMVLNKFGYKADASILEEPLALN